MTSSFTAPQLFVVLQQITFATVANFDEKRRMATPSNTTRFAVLKTSAISGICLLGEGATKKEALEDAFGPSPSTFVKKGSWVTEVTEERLAELKEEQANR